ncbi:MAG TPA: hypothetical protein VFP97_01730 [Chitinophagaceae bacterium]|nr:hypothetical protein [Chitinophagaceae bacterium]
MHELINKLAFSLFKKNSLEECSIEEITELANQYPYFSSAQLLLAAKEKQSEHPDFEQQLITASLHINNPLWLDHLLNSKSSIEIIAREEKKPVEEVLEEPNNDELVLEKNHHEFINASKKEEVETIPVQQTSPITGSGNPPHVFEPYYTVDYFASQGIKNVIEEKPKDRFSQQLKSFTEWLKTIKQLPPQQVAAMSDARSEEKVVELATHSIEDRNVETETMAEVWIKQGQPEKAAEIYRKLSLLNPSKSSYFASLIENLKKP